MQLLLLTGFAVVAGLTRYTLNPLQDAVRGQLLLTNNEIAILQGPALALPMSLMAIPLGVLLDRGHRVRWLLIFTVAEGFGTFLTAAAPGFGVLFMARCMVGGAMAAASTSIFTILSDLYRPQERGRATMIIVLAQYGGMSSAFALGGALVGAMGWRASVLWMILPVVAALMAGVGMREPARSQAAADQTDSPRVMKRLLGCGAQWIFILCALVLGELAIVAALTWAGPVLSRTYAVSPARAGAIIGFGLLISGTVGPLLGGLVADGAQRAGGAPRALWWLGWLALTAAALGMFGSSKSGVESCILLIAFLLIVSALLVGGIAAFTVVIPADLRGTCISILSGAQQLLGVATGPVAVSVLAAASGGRTALGAALTGVCAASCILAAVAFFAGAKWSIDGAS